MSSNNPFQNINQKQASISLQEHCEQAIVRKKIGRPIRPNMGKYLIKMDKGLHTKLSKYAEELGINNSFIISKALKEFFSKHCI